MGRQAKTAGAPLHAEAIRVTPTDEPSTLEPVIPGSEPTSTGQTQKKAKRKHLPAKCPRKWGAGGTWGGPQETMARHFWGWHYCSTAALLLL